jgi:hypothetical protein
MPSSQRRNRNEVFSWKHSYSGSIEDKAQYNWCPLCNSAKPLAVTPLLCSGVRMRSRANWLYSCSATLALGNEYCHVHGVYVTNNNGFWTGWLDLLALLLRLQSIITAHSQWLSKTRSIPYWTASVLYSTVTDLVLIYDSVTSSASVVRWLTLRSWTLNFWILLRLTYEWIRTWKLCYDRRSVGQFVLK